MGRKMRAKKEGQIAGQMIYFNGVDFISGGYLTPPVTLNDLVGIAAEEFNRMSPGGRNAALNFHKIRSAVTYGFNANMEDIQEARWGVIFTSDETEEVRNSFMPLIEHRSRQMGEDARIFTCRLGWTANEFLANYGVQSGFGDTEIVPYYLLLVGGPEKIPFRFQYELSGEYAVGRLAFNQAADYEEYISRLIDLETSTYIPNCREAAFWATANRSSDGEEDRATLLSSSILAQGLYDWLPASLGISKSFALASDATKASLAGLFCRKKPPVLLFTASHGLGFNACTPDQLRLQGALVTQDWKTDRPVSIDDIFSTEDILALPELNVRGMVQFAFACFGAGTPQVGDYSYGNLEPIAERPFTARLPTQMLKNGALGFVGHIDRSWGFSYIDLNNRPMLEGYKRAFTRILKGKLLGHALRDQYDHGVQLSARLIEDLNDMEWGKSIPPERLVNRWIERNDSRAYCLLGDPGAHIRINENV